MNLSIEARCLTRPKSSSSIIEARCLARPKSSSSIIAARCLARPKSSSSILDCSTRRQMWPQLAFTKTSGFCCGALLLCRQPMAVDSFGEFQNHLLALEAGTACFAAASSGASSPRAGALAMLSLASARCRGPSGWAAGSCAPSAAGAAAPRTAFRRTWCLC